MTSGTEGYERFTALFIERTQALDFHVICKDFIAFLPLAPANILDLGAGAGQNSAALDKLGFNVSAIEPMVEFLNAAKNSYKSTAVNWLHGSLPNIACLDAHNENFDFVLIDAVWHHLTGAERAKAACKITSVMNKNGRCAIPKPLEDAVSELS
jgi:2-polyprenyl-3-methyl-5-hydroxy-6-metoxy-1,4-benzoquinol methylase